MLPLTIKGREIWFEDIEEFRTIESMKLHLEHSLKAISEWEAKYEKHFIGNEENITPDEMTDYIRFMVIEDDVDPNFVYVLTKDDVAAIQNYMKKKQTATIIAPGQSSTSYQFITSELIYSWMAALQIPFECEKWNINRLLTLIHVANENNQPKKKMDPNVAMARQRAANAARRAKYHSKG